MEKWITIQAFTFSHEAYLVKTLLDAEGILSHVKDEHIVQAHPFYSNAVGGVKLQVKESDFQQAAKLLRDKGYINVPAKNSEQEIVNKLDKLSARLPLIGKESLPNRLFLFFIFFGVIISILLYQLLN